MKCLDVRFGHKQINYIFYSFRADCVCKCDSINLREASSGRLEVCGQRFAVFNLRFEVAGPLVVPFIQGKLAACSAVRGSGPNSDSFDLRKASSSRLEVAVFGLRLEVCGVQFGI